jgi:hypothetical protein
MRKRNRKINKGKKKKMEMYEPLNNREEKEQTRM